MDNEILAYCHIEKAAGTSIINVLRALYGTKYADARPLSRSHGNTFGRSDLSTYRRIIPGLRCIGGHSVVPYSDLGNGKPKIRFISLFRDPIERVVSHYRFWVNRMGSEFSPDDFLGHKVANNFQVRKIAGAPDLEKAKLIIGRDFALVGITEQFDEFLVALADLLRVPLDKMVYESRNIAESSSKFPLPESFRRDAILRNDLDSQLYSWIKNELVPEYCHQDRERFADRLDCFRDLRLAAKFDDAGFATKWLRRLYVKPVTGIIRVANGLSYGGLYAE